jgi:hypothetical protein
MHWIPAQGRDDKVKGRDDKVNGRDDKKQGQDDEVNDSIRIPANFTKAYPYFAAST